MTSRGKIKFFNTAKSYGFILPADGTSEVYFHGEVLAGGTMVRTGDSVNYTAELGGKGPRATEVALVDGTNVATANNFFGALGNK
jgi:CspA family cold shock protein